jgi:hypothetical protein
MVKKLNIENAEKDFKQQGEQTLNNLTNLIIFQRCIWGNGYASNKEVPP